MPEPFLPFDAPDVFKPRPAIAPIPTRPPGVIDAQIVPISNNSGIETIKIPPSTPTPTPPATPNSPRFPNSPTPAPRVTPPSPPASSYRSSGRIAGGFFPKVKPPGVGGLILRRALPGVGWALLAYDLYQLGCQTGILGETICPNPRNPLPGSTSADFQGGQCIDVVYRVFIQYRNSAAASSPVFEALNFFGPIGGVSFSGRDIFLSAKGNVSATRYPEVSPGVFRVFTASSGEITFAKITGILRSDGLVDNCGDPPSKPAARSASPDIVNIANITNNNIRIIAPPIIINPKPFPKLPPIIISPPSPLPILYENPNPSPQPQPQPQPQPEPTAQPQPNSPQPTPEPPIIIVPIPTPTSQPNPVPPPRPRDFDFSNCDPCSLYTMRGVYEILDKLYKVNGEILQIQETQAYHSKILENLQKLIDIELEGAHILKSCNEIDIVYSYKGKSFIGLNKHIEQLEKANNQILADICGIEANTQVAPPDWWQVRLGSNVPQICVAFRRVGYRDYYSLSIPHPKNTTKPSTSPLPAYKKGPWQGMIICTDNSKFIVNAETLEEANRICSIATTLIDPNFLESPPRIHISERKGPAVAVDQMVPRAVFYYSTGQQSMIPDWRFALHANDPLEQTGP